MGPVPSTPPPSRVGPPTTIGASLAPKRVAVAGLEGDPQVQANPREIEMPETINQHADVLSSVLQVVAQLCTFVGDGMLKLSENHKQTVADLTSFTTNELQKAKSEVDEIRAGLVNQIDTVQTTQASVVDEMRKVMEEFGMVRAELRSGVEAGDGRLQLLQAETKVCLEKL